MDNFKKEIWSVFIITALLGVFFQINRMDVFFVSQFLAEQYSGRKYLAVYGESKGCQGELFADL